MWRTRIRKPVRAQYPLCQVCQVLAAPHAVGTSKDVVAVIQVLLNEGGEEWETLVALVAVEPGSPITPDESQSGATNSSRV